MLAEPFAAACVAAGCMIHADASPRPAAGQDDEPGRALGAIGGLRGPGEPPPRPVDQLPALGDVVTNRGGTWHFSRWFPRSTDPRASRAHARHNPMDAFRPERHGRQQPKVPRASRERPGRAVQRLFAVPKHPAAQPCSLSGPPPGTRRAEEFPTHGEKETGPGQTVHDDQDAVPRLLPQVTPGLLMGDSGLSLPTDTQGRSPRPRRTRSMLLVVEWRTRRKSRTYVSSEPIAALSE